MLRNSKDNEQVVISNIRHHLMAIKIEDHNTNMCVEEEDNDKANIELKSFSEGNTIEVGC